MLTERPRRKAMMYDWRQNVEIALPDLPNGVRDRIEEDISRAGRGELEAVLREEWENRDKVSRS